MEKPIAFRMQLRPGCQAEYEKRHDEIWPELKALLGEAGISDYSIFLDESTDVLIGVLRLAPDADREALPSHPVMQRWWAYMADLMVTGEGDRPAETPLRSVFYFAGKP
jgi:L-rhamnose mutarotase